MDKKIIKTAIFIFIIEFTLCSCNVKRNKQENIIQECKIENGLALILINENRIRFNEVNYIVVGAVLHPETVELINHNLIIKAPTEKLVNYKEGFVYEIEVYWFGGHILASGIYNNGNFEIIKEKLYYN